MTHILKLSRLYALSFIGALYIIWPLLFVGLKPGIILIMAHISACVVTALFGPVFLMSTSTPTRGR